LIKTVRKNRGFTLVELLVVIAIVAILAAVVLLIIDPAEIQRRGRDSSRLADLSNLNNAISTSVTESDGNAEAVLCDGGTYPCTGASFPVGADTRKNDGSGWVKVDMSSGSIKVPTLYVDPTNDATYHFTYCADNDAWELNTTLESNKESVRMANDGGDQNAVDNTGKYEVGSNLTLINSSGTPCAY
jgi:prepilin-type N-terminal cleavage/methylation domain-containing protein